MSFLLLLSLSVSFSPPQGWRDSQRFVNKHAVAVESAPKKLEQYVAPGCAWSSATKKKQENTGSPRRPEDGRGRRQGRERGRKR